jgi:hypothetical protein
MGGFASLAAAGASIGRMLSIRFGERQPISDDKPTAVALMRTDDFAPAAFALVASRPALTVFLYRVDSNKSMRAGWSAIGSYDGRSHLAVDLHFLLTAWADSADEEHRILGRAMQAIEDTPILSGPLLADAGDWAGNEALNLVLEDVATEALVRLFDSLPVDYRLSIPYVARMIRIDGTPAGREPPVVTAELGARVGAGSP